MISNWLFERGEGVVLIDIEQHCCHVDIKQLATLALIRELAVTGEARRLRIAAKIRLTEMAPTVGVAAGTLSRWESGKRMPSAAAALAWFAALQLIADASSGGSDAS